MTAQTAHSIPRRDSHDHAPVGDDDQTDQTRARIMFDASAEKDNHPRHDTALYIPGPRERDQGKSSCESTGLRVILTSDQGHPIVELEKESAIDDGM